MNKKHTLDLKDVDCPLSFIKTRKFIYLFRIIKKHSNRSITKTSE